MGKVRAKPHMKSKVQVWDPVKARVEATRMLVGNFDNWPVWPILPMRNEIEKDKGSHRLGVMTEEDTDTYNVYLINLFQIKRGMDWDALPVAKFDTVEELIDSGWRLD